MRPYNNVMNSFLASLEKIFPRNHKGSVVGIDIGTSSIKVVELEVVDERFVLKNYGEISLGALAGVETGKSVALSPEKLAGALKEILREAGIETKHASFAMPFNASLLTVAELPDVGRKDLENMIPLEARRYIPVPMDEVTIDWWVLPKRKNEIKAGTGEQGKGSLGKVEVIIAAIHNKVINNYESIKKQVGLSDEASHFEIEIFSTLRAVVGGDLVTTLVVDIGAAGTKLTLVDDGIVRGSHVVPMGGQDVTLALARALALPFSEAENIKCGAGIAGEAQAVQVRTASETYFSRTLNETKHFIENYEHKYDTKIKKIILVGGGATLQGVDKKFEETFPNTSVFVGDPFSRLETPAFLGPTLKELSPHFSVAVGVALKALED